MQRGTVGRTLSRGRGAYAPVAFVLDAGRSGAASAVRLLTKGGRQVFTARALLLAAGVCVCLTASVAAVAGGPKADLAVTAVDSADPVLVGRDLAFRVVVTNLGPQRASRVKLALTVTGPGQVVRPLSAAGGSCRASTGSQAVCSWGTLASKRRVSVALRVDSTDVGTVSLTAVVSSATADGKRRNNSVVHTTRVLGLDTVQGRGIRSTMGDAGRPIVTTEIDARRDPTVGTTSGTFLLQYDASSRSPARGSDLRGRVVCLAVSGNRAMVGGVVESSNTAAYPAGTGVRLAFTDNGEPGAGRDTTTAFVAVEPTCALDQADELPLIEGDYVVRDGEP